MKTMHLVAPRTGPNNSGDTNCTQCDAVVFNSDGSIAYDPDAAAHTTDPETYALCGTNDMPDFVKCTP